MIFGVLETLGHACNVTVKKKESKAGLEEFLQEVIEAERMIEFSMFQKAVSTPLSLLEGVVLFGFVVHCGVCIVPDYSLKKILN